MQVVISSQRDWPQPSLLAITVGMITNMPNSGAVLISRTRNPISTRGSRQVRRRPDDKTSPAFSPAGASRLDPDGSFTPNHTIKKPSVTRPIEAHMASVSPSEPPRNNGIVPAANSEPSVGRPPVNMT